MAIRKRRSIFEMIDEYFEDIEKRAKQFEETFIERPSWNQKECSVEPLRDVMVTPKEVVVTVDLPLSEQNTVKVTPLDRKTIEISAKMKRKVCFNDFGITHYKGEFQAFHCHTRIPVQVSMDKIKVSFKKGMLEVRIPRKREQIVKAI